VRDGHDKGKVNDLVLVDNVAWVLEMVEMEERALDRNFAWDGHSSPGKPQTGEANWVKTRGTTHI